MIMPAEGGVRVVFRLQDVLDVPLQMHERAELIRALLDRALEPLTQSQGSLADVQTGFVLRLLKIQRRTN